MRSPQPRPIPVPIILLVAAIAGFLFSIPMVLTKPLSLSGIIETSTPELENRIAKLEDSLAKATKIQERLLALVGEIHGQQVEMRPTSASRENVTATNGALGSSTQQARPMNRFATSRRERLVEAGIPQDRVDRILAREWELRYEQQQLRHRYKHLEDQSTDEAAEIAGNLERYDNVEEIVGSELSPWEYERYREAITPGERMLITAVLEGSNAANAGISPGDELLSYNGTPVTDVRTMRSLLDQAVPGSSVPVVIRRLKSNSESTVYVSAGPLGVQTAFGPRFLRQDSDGDNP